MADKHIVLWMGLSKAQNWTPLSYKKTSGSSGSTGGLVFRFMSLISWQYMGHNTQQDVSLLLSPIKVTPWDDWEDLLEPVYFSLTSPAAAYKRDPSLRVTLASLPCFIKQLPTGWVRQDPIWLCNTAFHGKIFLTLKSPVSGRGVIYSSGLACDSGKDKWCKLSYWPLTFPWHGKIFLTLNYQRHCKWLSTRRCCSSEFLTAFCILLDAKTQKL